MWDILVIDDEEALRKVDKAMLEHEGHEIMEASSGKPGMRLQRENPADLVISDLIMPEQEGIETIMELRREFPETKILAISGGGTNRPEDYLLIARGVGAHQVLKKPFKRSELLRAVEDLLNK